MKTEKFVIDKIEIKHGEDTPDLLLTLRLSSRIWDIAKFLRVGDLVDVPVEEWKEKE